MTLHQLSWHGRDHVLWTPDTCKPSTWWMLGCCTQQLLRFRLILLERVRMREEEGKISVCLNYIISPF